MSHWYGLVPVWAPVESVRVYECVGGSNHLCDYFAIYHSILCHEKQKAKKQNASPFRFQLNFSKTIFSFTIFFRLPFIVAIFCLFFYFSFAFPPTALSIAIEFIHLFISFRFVYSTPGRSLR